MLLLVLFIRDHQLLWPKPAKPPRIRINYFIFYVGLLTRVASKLLLREGVQPLSGYNEKPLDDEFNPREKVDRLLYRGNECGTPIQISIHFDRGMDLYPCPLDGI